MKTLIKNTLLGGALLLGSSASMASLINVGGVVWDPSSPADFFSEASLTEQTVQVVGDTLSGFGKISSMNSLTGPNQSDFCPSCELTFSFGGFTVSADVSSAFAFSGGWMKIYVDGTPDYTLSDAADGGLSTATNGDLWLDLKAVEYFEATALNGAGSTGTLFGSLSAGSLSSPEADEKGSGDGFFSVEGGLAASNFDTDFFKELQVLTQHGFTTTTADLSFSSSFQPSSLYSNFNTGLALKGTGELAGNSIPEPTSLALLGLGLLGFGATRKRK